MMIGLLWIIGVYGASAAILHLIHAWYRRKESSSRIVTVALLTYNQELQIEWYIRSLLLVSWLRGRAVQVLVFDEGSEDDTLQIVRHLAETRPEGQVRVAEETLDAFLQKHSEEEVVVHRLRPLGKHEGLPLLQW